MNKRAEKYKENEKDGLEKVKIERIIVDIMVGVAKVDFDDIKFFSSLDKTNKGLLINIINKVLMVEKKLYPSNKFSDITRMNAIKAWYLINKKRNTLPRPDADERINKILGKEIADEINHMCSKNNAKKNLIAEYAEEIKLAIEECGLYAVQRRLRCNSTLLHDYFYNNHRAWYSSYKENINKVPPKIIKEMESLREEGMSYEKILREINSRHPNNPKLANMAAATIKNLIDNNN